MNDLVLGDLPAIDVLLSGLKPAERVSLPVQNRIGLLGLAMLLPQRRSKLVLCAKSRREACHDSLQRHRRNRASCAARRERVHCSWQSDLEQLVTRKYVNCTCERGLHGAWSATVAEPRVAMGASSVTSAMAIREMGETFSDT